MGSIRGYEPRESRECLIRDGICSIHVINNPACVLHQGIRPDHYGGPDNPYEVIKVIHAWDLGFDLGNVVKYVARAGKKHPEKTIEDLEKAKTYIDFAIAQAKAEDVKGKF